MATTIDVEVVYARAEGQTVIALTVAHGMTASEAVVASGILDRYPELAPGGSPIGVFGRIVTADYVLAAGDRVEIYRPLVADPKASRNERVAKKRQARENRRNMRAAARTKKTTRGAGPPGPLC